MSERIKPCHLRQIVSDRVRMYLESGGNPDKGATMSAVRDDLSREYRGSPYLEILIRIAEILIPVLLLLFAEPPKSPIVGEEEGK